MNAIAACAAALALAATPGPSHGSSQREPRFHVDVQLVQVSLTVKDKHGDYIKGLKPGDFAIREDGIPQKIVHFAEGVQPAGRTILGSSNVFVLFDTSNCMYGDFAYAEDAIAGFMRGLDPSTAIALYTFSANMVRSTPLTGDHQEAIAGLRNSVAGASTALYNSILLTIRDAAKVSGSKTIVVFSNGPDDASIISPHDVRRIAQDEGISIYIVSTKRQDSVSQDAFESLTAGTGGRIYYARDWKQQVKAFKAIREELAHTYTLGYYPAANPNRGFRRIEVEVAGDRGNKLQVRTRSGYHPAEVEQAAVAEAAGGAAGR